MKAKSETVAVNGTRLYYELEGSGPVVTLLHGFSLDYRMWDGQLDTFAREFRVLRYDLRGFGRSGGAGPEPYAPADDLRALLDHLDIESTAVVGLSMGGGFAIDFALAYPERTTALVAADSALAGFEWTGGRPSAWHAELASTQGVAAAKQAWLDCVLFQPAAEQPAVAAALRRLVDCYSGWHRHVPR
jgi:pimeloyl-ACP methyl ester carboxylesterase